MPAGVPLINGRAYDWASITIEMLGFVVRGVKAIKYEAKQEKVNNYGAGNEPVSRGYGKKEYEASITLERKEIERIYDALGAGLNLLDVPAFTIVVAFSENYKKTTHKLLMCEFTNDSVDAKQGDTKIEPDLKLIVGVVLFN